MTGRTAVKDTKTVRAAFTKFVRKYKPRVVLETGTHLGTGTTRIFGEAVKDICTYYTVECNFDYYQQATKNLADLTHVFVYHGLTLKRQDMLQWIQIDPWMTHHQKISDIMIDGHHNPIEFYQQEISHQVKDNVLVELIQENAENQPMLVLDSAGGVGYLEFLTATALLADQEYTVFLDDVNHIKHCRSLAYVLGSHHFTDVLHHQAEGWMLAYHQPTPIAGVARSVSVV